MLRVLRAFAWMRWRLLVNSLERNGAIRQREIGLAGATDWLADRFLA